MKKIVKYLLVFFFCFTLIACGERTLQLPAPNSINLDGNLLRWKEVPNAYGYAIKIEGIENTYSTIATSYDILSDNYISNNIGDSATFIVQLKSIASASSGYINSDWTIPTSFSWTKAQAPEQNINTHIIRSIDDLKEVIQLDDYDAIFKLNNDIDGHGEYWTPIETFKGTLIGEGHSIKNFKIKSCSSENNNTFFCGFIYNNTGSIKNIHFEDITISASIEQQTNSWRYMNVGLIARNEKKGIINDVHLDNITIVSSLKHKYDNDYGYSPKQENITGGLVGINQGTISYCSIKNSTITASADAKTNCCETTTIVGGICGKATGSVSNMLAVRTTVKAKSRGGFWGGLFHNTDGSLAGYAGNIFGYIGCNASKIISFDNDEPTISLEITHDNPDCKKNYCGDAIGFSDSANIQKLFSNSTNRFVGNDERLGTKWTAETAKQINGWEYWSLIGNSIEPENYIKP